MLERILVPLDGSPFGEAILTQLRGLLRRKDSEVILVRVADPPGFEGSALVLEEIMAEVRRYLRKMTWRLIDDIVRAQNSTQIGAPAEGILRAAEEESATMIAMTTHGRTGLPRLMYGSVAEEVLRTSPIPVFILRSFQTDTTGGFTPVVSGELKIRSILVPVDGSDLSLKVVPCAEEMAKLFGARIVLLHVVEPHGDPKRAQWGAEQLNAIRMELAARGLPVLTLLEEGDPALVIRTTTRFHDCDLIAMTTHGRSGLSRMFFGSVTEDVLRRAPVPMLVVRTAKAAVAKELPR